MKHQAGDAAIYYEIHGDAEDSRRPWVIFSHSVACASAMWRPQLAEFSKTYRVLAFDTRGHGRSDATPGPYSFEQLAGDLHSLLGALRITKAHFVGLSMGGMIGQTYALAHPGVFTSLTLADSTSQWPESARAMFADRAKLALEEGMEPHVAPTLGRWFTPAFHRSNPDEVARVAAMIRSTSPVGYAASCACIPYINTTTRLREITCPMLVIVGRDDPGTPVEMSRTIHENAPGSKLVIIDDAAHLSNLEQPAIFSRTLSEFLSSVDKR